jgi:hypothetical protein
LKEGARWFEAAAGSRVCIEPESKLLVKKLFLLSLPDLRKFLKENLILCKGRFCQSLCFEPIALLLNLPLRVFIC